MTNTSWAKTMQKIRRNKLAEKVKLLYSIQKLTTCQQLDWRVYPQGETQLNTAIEPMFQELSQKFLDDSKDGDISEGSDTDAYDNGKPPQQSTSTTVVRMFPPGKEWDHNIQGISTTTNKKSFQDTSHINNYRPKTKTRTNNKHPTQVATTTGQTK